MRNELTPALTIPALQPQRRDRMPWPLLALLSFIGAITVFGKGPTYLIYPPLYWGEVTLAISLGWVVLRAYGGWIRRPICWLALAFVLLGGGITVANAGTYGLEAFRDYASCYYALFVLVGFFLADDPALGDRFWRWVNRLWVLALIWVVLCMLTRFRVVEYSPMLWWRGVRLFSGSGSENQQQMAMGALVLAMGIPLLPKRRALPPLVCIPLILYGALILVTSNGRGAKIAVLCGLLAGLLATVGQRRSVWSFSRSGVLLYAMILVLLIGAIAAGPSGLGRTLGERVGYERLSKANPWSPGGTAQWRLVWWRNIADAVEERNPLLGLGFGINLSDFNPYLDMDEQRHPVRSPHNIHMTFFGRMGYLGGVMWIALLVLGLLPLFLCLRLGPGRRREYTLERRRELTLWFIFIVATVINASFGVLMEGPVLGVWFWLALGFALGRSRDPSGYEIERGPLCGYGQPFGSVPPPVAT